MSFEDELRGALRREPAPPDFAAKVLAAAKAPTKPPGKVITIPFWRRPAVAVAMAAGLAFAALIHPAISDYHRRQEIRAFEARRELLIALTITRTKLTQARVKIQHAAMHNTQRRTL
jgi:hypothetical protein